MVAGYVRTGTEPAIEAAVATGLVLLYALFVVVRVNRAWVLLAAEAYARQLLAGCDLLPVKETKVRGSRSAKSR
jgi:hypothetical protein